MVLVFQFVIKPNSPLANKTRACNTSAFIAFRVRRSAEFAVLAKDLHQLGDLFLAGGFVAAAEGVCDAVFQMTFENDRAGFFQSSGCRSDLREDVDAVFVFIDHPRDGRDLAFGAAKSLSDVGFVVVAQHALALSDLKTGRYSFDQTG